MTTAAALPDPDEAPVLTVVPDLDEEAWNFGKVPVQGELFPRNYAA
jgi:hypothetical protein